MTEAETATDELDSTGDDEAGITMVDVLQEEVDMQQNVDAVLGPSDDSKCTYEKGYMKRQALYACLTCCPNGTDKRAGICLGCSYHCHSDHNLVELYTKRLFRCDCGNSKFENQPCELTKEKDSENINNSYNQNFIGNYCKCNRPYPDPDDTIEDQMIQCCLCEDWYHGRHLGCVVPPAEDYGEMICDSCVSRHSFLQYYATLAVTSNSQEANDNETVDILTVDEEPEIYSRENVEFLVDVEDSVHFYENCIKEGTNTSGNSEREIAAFSTLDRITQVEMVHEYNTLSSSLRNYLRKFADNKKVVRDEDIREFFAQLSANKKPRSDMQLFCK